MVTPLHQAVNSEAVKALLFGGDEICKRFFQGDTILHVAASGGWNESLLVLLEGVEVDRKNYFCVTTSHYRW